MNLPRELLDALHQHIQDARTRNYKGGFVLITGMKELHNQVMEVEGTRFRWRYHKDIPTAYNNRDHKLSDVYIVTKGVYKRDFMWQYGRKKVSNL